MNSRLITGVSGPWAWLPGPVLGPALDVNLTQTDRILPPNCPGRKPGEIGTGVGPFALGFQPKPAQKPAPGARPGDRKHD